MIRPATHNDLPAVLRLNEAALPHVSSVTLKDMETFLDTAASFLITEVEGEIAGFMIVLRKGLDYSSLNYAFFNNNYTSFEYVDRIVVGESYRGQKLGTDLYQHLFQATDQERVCCEINLQPPNPGSMAFHQGLGFEQVAELRTDKAQKRVAMMIKRM